MSEALKPLTLRQVYGLNPLIPPQDLTRETDEQLSFVYISGNLTIIQKEDDQIILHGHTNDVSAFDISPDKSILVTGEKSSLIVWDSKDLEPCFVFDNEEYTPGCLKFNRDSSKFASLDISSSPGLGKIRIYDLSQNSNVSDRAAAAATTTTTLKDKNSLKFLANHTKLCFNHLKSEDLMSFGPTSLAFFDVANSSDTISPVGKGLTLSEFNINGSICDAKFLKSTSANVEVATTMSNGHVVIWSGPSLSKVTYNRTIKLAGENEALTTITLLSDSTIVIGSSFRKIRFYDENIKLKNWIASKEIVPSISGNITSISLMYEPSWLGNTSKNKATTAKMAETTLEGQEFATKKLLVTTTHGEVVRISHQGTTNKESKSSVYSYGKSADKITAFVPHPNQSLVALGLQESNTKVTSIELFDYETHIRLARKNLSEILKKEEDEIITCVSFDERGIFLIAGTSSGRLFAFDSLTLEPIFKFLLSTRISGQCEVEKIVFSRNWFAVSDSTFAVTLFKIESQDVAIASGDSTTNNQIKEPQFQYLGRSRMHTSKIVSMEILGNILMTIGFDRYMVEYDLTSTKFEGEQSKISPVIEPTRLEQTARPVGAIIHPEIESKSNEKFLLTVTDQHKLRLFNIKTRLARRMTLAPVTGAPISSLKLIPKQKLLAYSAGGKIGLILLPADGNPWGQTAILAHPSGVDSIAISFCGKYMFSLAKNTANHGCLQCWEICKTSLEAQHALSPDGIEPFISLMDQGRTGQIFNHLKTHFYSASVQHQGIQTSENRKIKESLPLKYLPNILRACGLYPSEKEIEDMANEVLFWKYGTGESDHPNAEITLGDVVKLYINYRHINEDGSQVDPRALLIDAIKALNVKNTGSLLEVMQTTSEAIGEDELASILACLGNILPEGVEQDWPANYTKGETEMFMQDLGKAIPRRIEDIVSFILDK